MIVTLDEVKQYLRVDFSDRFFRTFVCVYFTSGGFVFLPQQEETKTAVLYSVAYLYEYREEANHNELMLTLRSLLFEFDGDKKAIRHVLYNCSASRLSIESETREESIEPGTETLSLTADPREDGLVKSRTGDTTGDSTYQNWYKTVYVPVARANTSPSTTLRQ